MVFPLLPLSSLSCNYPFPFKGPRSLGAFDCNTHSIQVDLSQLVLGPLLGSLSLKGWPKDMPWRRQKRCSQGPPPPPRRISMHSARQGLTAASAWGVTRWRRGSQSQLQGWEQGGRPLAGFASP
jgi:hypothetical protein